MVVLSRKWGVAPVHHVQSLKMMKFTTNIYKSSLMTSSIWDNDGDDNWGIYPSIWGLLVQQLEQELVYLDGLLSWLFLAYPYDILSYCGRWLYHVISDVRWNPRVSSSINFTPLYYTIIYPSHIYIYAYNIYISIYIDMYIYIYIHTFFPF